VRILGVAAQWLFILCLPVLLLTASIGVAVNSLWLYKYGFEKYNVSQATGLVEAELEKAGKGLIGYFNSWLDYWVLLGTLIYILGYAGVSLFWRKRRYWRQLAWGVVGGGSITLALVLALGLGTLLGFDQLFLQFHLISFTNPFWQLDPTRDYLIMFFPQGFWYDATLFCALATAFGAVVSGGVAGVCLRRTKRQTS